MNQIDTVFKNYSIKPTPLKQAILNILINHNKPLSAPEIQQQLKKINLTPNKTSLYRHLEMFVEKKVIQTLFLQPKIVHYEFQQHHHHHFTCNNCEYVQCLKDDVLENAIHSVENQIIQKGIKVQKHHFSFSGLCATCNTL